jgi:uncharacterized protein (TIGR03067 family)
MDPLLTAVASNLAVATALACVAVVVSRFFRRPQLAHALWMLVLVKLITPPIVGVRMPAFPQESFIGASAVAHASRRGGEDGSAIDVGGANADSTLRNTSPLRALPEAVTEDIFVPSPPTTAGRVELPAEPATATSIPITVVAPIAAAPPPIVDEWRDQPPPWRAIVYSVWVAGGVLFAAVFIGRYGKVGRLLAERSTVDLHVTEAARRLAKQMGLARCPGVRVVDARIPPLVWGLTWRPVIILPQNLLGDLDPAQRDAVLAHELAHVLRRDHLVRWLEVIVLVPFWFNPLAWWARRELRRAEEECCDAHVVWLLPESRREYGRALVKTLEFLSSGTPAASAAASAFGKPFFKRRIEMILNRSQKPKMSWAGWAAMLVLSAAVVPLGAQSVTDEDAPPQPGKTHDARGPDITADPTDALPLPEEASITVNPAALEDVPPQGGPYDLSERQVTSLHAALDRETAEKARFHGSWKVVDTRHNGTSTPSQFEYYYWFFDAGESTARTQWKRRDGETHTTEEARSFRFVVNPEASPGELTIYGNNMLIQAIYKWEDGRLVICFYGRSEKDRPGQFPGDGSTTPPPRSPLPVIEFELVKDDSLAARSITSEANRLSSNIDVSRALDRLRHLEGLARKGYASDAQVESDLFALKQAIERASKDAPDLTTASNAVLAQAESDYRRIRELATKGLVSTTELDQKRAAYQQAQVDDKYTAIEREAQGQLLELDVAEARLKIDAAEAQLEAVRELHESNAVPDQELEQREYNLELAKIELKRAEIKLSLHRQQGGGEQSE